MSEDQSDFSSPEEESEISEEDNDSEIEEEDEDEEQETSSDVAIEESTHKKEKPDSTPGIIYLSRIPPFMKPHKVKQLLSHYGSVGRIYLQLEDESVRQRRKKFGGNKKRNFTEGWVEFLDKRAAKAVALMLNNTPIGGKKRNYYHDDLWNMKYLPKFRWTHLTEKIAYEQAVREQKMRTEISQAKRENSHYLSSVEKSREIQAIVERKRKRGATEDEVSSSVQRKFKQRRVDEKPSNTSAESKMDILKTRKTSSTKKTSANSTKSVLSDTLLKKILPG